MQTKVTRLDYCQYLLVSQINYTLTHFADHCAQYSHDAINRYLRGEQITPEASKTEHERRIFLERKLASTRPMILINFL